MRMTNEVDIYQALESAQSSETLVKNADSSTPYQFHWPEISVGYLESEFFI